MDGKHEAELSPGDQLMVRRLRRDAEKQINDEVKTIARNVLEDLQRFFGRGMAAMVVKELLVDLIELAIVEERGGKL